jgi:hypothetical protein
MTQEERPRQAAEPDTTFEPAAVENEAEQTATRRAVNLASHAGVGVAGAGGVVVVQQLTRPQGDDNVSSAEALDVFQDAGGSTAPVEQQGVSAEAEPVLQQSTSTTGSFAQPGAEHPPPAQPATRPVEPPPAADLASFNGPVDTVSEQPNSFAPAADMTPPVQPGSMDVPDIDVEELERETYLASAEVDIGGGFAADSDDSGAGSIYGASSEYGVIPVDDHPDDGDDEDLASTP